MPPNLNEMQKIVREDIQNIAYGFNAINKHMAELKKRVIAIENNIRNYSRMLAKRDITAKQFIDSLSDSIKQTKHGFEALLIDENSFRSEIEQIRRHVQFRTSEEARRASAPFAVKSNEAEEKIVKRSQICVKNITSLDAILSIIATTVTITDFSGLIASLGRLYAEVYDNLNEIDNISKRVMRDILSFYRHIFKDYQAIR